MLVYPPLITKLTTNHDDFIHVKLLFIVLSLVASLLLPIKRLIIEVKGLPTHRDSTTLHSGVTVMISFKITPPSPSNHQSTPMPMDLKCFVHWQRIKNRREVKKHLSLYQIIKPLERLCLTRK